MSTSSRNPSSRHSAPQAHGLPTWPFLVADIVLVAVFSAIGRSSHGEDLAGTFVTAWPFLVGTLIGWLISRAWRAPQALLPAGVIVWLSTVVVGMVVRPAMHAGTHWSFIVVATIVTAVFLLGYRILAKPILRRRAARAE